MLLNKYNACLVIRYILLAKCITHSAGRELYRCLLADTLPALPAFIIPIPLEVPPAIIVQPVPPAIIIHKREVSNDTGMPSLQSP